MKSLLERLASLPAEARQYNLDHLVEHLYQAQDWPRLFELLDTGQFGQAKIQYDPSTRSYAQDLDLGRRAAAWEKWTLEEGLEHLPHLWRYTLLRSSLTSWANNYPNETFQLLLLLKQEQKAKDLAELLTDSLQKAHVLLLIAEFLMRQPGREADALQIVSHFHEVISSMESDTRKFALSWLVRTLAQAGAWAQAELVLADIQEDEPRVQALTFLGLALAQKGQEERAWKILNEAERLVADMQEGKDPALKSLGEALAWSQRWEEAERIIETIQDNREKVNALSSLGFILAQRHQQEKARKLWSQAEKLLEGIYYGRAEGWEALGEALAQAQQWSEARRVIAAIDGSREKAKALSILGLALAQAEQIQSAKKVWEEAEKLITTEVGSYYKLSALADLGEVLIRVQQWSEAERVIKSIENSITKAKVLSTLGLALARGHQEECAQKVLDEVEGIIISIRESAYERDLEMPTVNLVLNELGSVLAQAQQIDRARVVWKGIEQQIVSSQNYQNRDSGLYWLRETFAKTHQWEDAKRVIDGIQAENLRIGALIELESTLKLAHQWEQAQEVSREVEQAITEIQDSRTRSTFLIRLKRWEQAEQLMKTLPKDLKQTNWKGLIRGLVQAQRFEHARHVITEIQNNWDKLEAQEELGIAFIQVQQWDLAEQTIRSIKHAYRQLCVWKEWGKTLTLAGQEERAQVAWGEMQWLIKWLLEPGRDKAEKLLELGQVLAELQQWEKALEVWDMSAQAIADIEDDRERMRVLPELGQVLAHAQQWERFQRVCDEIEHLAIAEENLWERDQWWGYLAELLVIAQRWKEAEQVIERTQDINEDERRIVREKETEKALALAERAVALFSSGEENPRTTALTKLGVALTQAQQWQEAERVIARIQDSVKKAEAFAGLAMALTQVQQWQEAAHVIVRIQDSVKKAEAFAGLAMALTQVQQWQEAERIIGNIQSDRERIGALARLGKVLVLAGQWEEAERVAADSQDVLKSIADHLTNAGQYEDLLHFVQRSCKQVTTRDSALHLLPIAYGLIPLKPKMGSAFFEAFTWVDDFFHK